MEARTRLGKEISVYKTTSICLGQAKKENRQGVKSRFVALTLKDRLSIGAKPVTHYLFEDEIGTAAYEELCACRIVGDDNKLLKDPRGYYVVDAVAVKANSVKRKQEDEDGEDPLMLDTLLRWEGGMTQTYKFPDGMRYANDAEGKRTLDKHGNPVIKSSVDVFVVVREEVLRPDGTKDYEYISGMSLNARGERMMNTFFTERVKETPTLEREATDGVDSSDEPDF